MSPNLVDASPFFEGCGAWITHLKNVSVPPVLSCQIW